MMKKSVLIIHDSDSIRKIIALTLYQIGYDTIEACNGLDALIKLKNNNVNIIICDLNTINISNFEFLKHYKQRASSPIPVIMLTTEKHFGQIYEAKNLDVTAWMVKPFGRDKLLQTISYVSH